MVHHGSEHEDENNGTRQMLTGASWPMSLVFAASASAIRATNGSIEIGDLGEILSPASRIFLENVGIQGSFQVFGVLVLRSLINCWDIVKEHGESGCQFSSERRRPTSRLGICGTV